MYGCLEDVRANHHQFTQVYSARACHPQHTNPNTRMAHCMSHMHMKELGKFYYPIGNGQYALL